MCITELSIFDKMDVNIAGISNQPIPNPPLKKKENKKIHDNHHHNSSEVSRKKKVKKEKRGWRVVNINRVEAKDMRLI